MTESPFKMRFDPQTIKHLGVRMYSTLAPALSEIISNAYDADASEVVIILNEIDGNPDSITVIDTGSGISLEEINNKFLVIGRNRRIDEGDIPSKVFKRLPTGKKGLGKLALFGLADTITITTIRDSKLNEFILDWNDLMKAEGEYKPRANIIEQDTDKINGTTIKLSNLKRKTPFDFNGLADSLSRIFLFDSNFNLILISPTGVKIQIDNFRKYSILEKEFEWNINDNAIIPKESEYYGLLKGCLLTSNKPITPASGLRGITLFSRGKLVNSPEFFSNSTSSHFFQYLTGWVSVDFIDLIEDDVISTNRQSIDWENPEMSKMRKFLSGIIAQINIDWRRLRKEKKNEELKDITGIDTETWTKTLPRDVRESTQAIIESLGGEDALEKYTPIIKALHNIIPEYPLLHWRHLHKDIKDRIKVYYENHQYGDAASQGVQIYCELIRRLTSKTEDGSDLVNRVFGSKPFSPLPEIQLNDLSTDSLQNIQIGQGHLSRGIVTGFRNPVVHDPIDSVVPAIFSELDCLNILSLVSYLATRLDNATINRTT